VNLTRYSQSTFEEISHKNNLRKENIKKRKALCQVPVGSTRQRGALPSALPGGTRQIVVFFFIVTQLKMKKTLCRVPTGQALGKFIFLFLK
jgi:hypothetical protein